MKTVDEIFGEMLVCFGERTGMEVDQGCDLAVRLYAAAAQIYAMYLQADWVARQAFPQTAEGDYLDLHAQLRGLERKQASHAAGTLRFFADQAAETPREIPLGTVCMTAGLVRFETTRAAVLPVGQLQVDVPARALLAGSAGNAAAGTVLSMAVAPVGIRRCDNPEPFLGGSDGETDSELRKRVLDTFQRLPNGANAAFYEQGALSFDEVAAASVLPRSRGIGTVDVVVSTHSGQADPALLEQLQTYFQSRREIAVDVQVRAPEQVKVDVTVRIQPAEGSDRETVAAGVEAAVRNWFSGERLGKPVLLAQLYSLVFSCGGVANCKLAAPADDVEIAAHQLPVLGTLTVEELTRAGHNICVSCWPLWGYMIWRAPFRTGSWRPWGRPWIRRRPRWMSCTGSPVWQRPRTGAWSGLPPCSGAGPLPRLPRPCGRPWPPCSASAETALHWTPSTTPSPAAASTPGYGRPGRPGRWRSPSPRCPGSRPALTRSKRSWRTSSRPICWYSTTFGISPGPSWSLNFPAGRRLRTRPSHGPGWRPMWSRRMDPDKRRRGPRILSCGSPSFFYFWASSVSSVWTISKTRASQCSFRVTPASLARVSRAAHSVA